MANEQATGDNKGAPPAPPAGKEAPPPAPPAAPAPSSLIDGKEAAAAVTGKPPAPPPGVPEKYDLKLPKDSLVPEAALVKIADLARQRGFTNEQAQAFVEQHSALYAEHVTAESQAQAAHFTQLQDSWKANIAKDPVLGGERLGESMEVVKRFVDKRFSPELKKLLVDSGLHNNDHVFRFLYAMGKDDMNDRAAGSGAAPAGAPQKKSLEQIYQERADAAKKAVAANRT